jgi:hypothetical protein
MEHTVFLRILELLSKSKKSLPFKDNFGCLFHDSLSVSRLYNIDDRVTIE